MTVPVREDPFLAFNFLVEIDGLEVGGFKEVSGLHIKINHTAYFEGGGLEHVHNLIGRPSYNSVTLSKGMTTSTELWNWVIKTAEGEIQSRHVSIILKEFVPDATETRWELFNAMPTEWRGGYLNAMKNGVAVESLTLVFSRIKRESRRIDPDNHLNQENENVVSVSGTTIV